MELVTTGGPGCRNKFQQFSTPRKPILVGMGWWVHHGVVTQWCHFDVTGFNCSNSNNNLDSNDDEEEPRQWERAQQVQMCFVWTIGEFYFILCCVFYIFILYIQVIIYYNNYNNYNYNYNYVEVGIREMRAGAWDSDESQDLDMTLRPHHRLKTCKTRKMCLEHV